MTIVTDWGLTWTELYQVLGVVTLFVVLAAQLGAPVVGAVDPLLWTSGALAAFAAVTVVQLWTAYRISVPFSR